MVSISSTIKTRPRVIKFPFTNLFLNRMARIPGITPSKTALIVKPG